MKCRTVSVFIRRPADEVYEFVLDARTLPEWATGFCRSVRPAGDAWVLETPLGEVGFRFAERNGLGVLDHTVTLASGEEVVNPMRVLKSGPGCTVIFTMFQPPGMSDVEFLEDCSLVETDLRNLKRALEG